MNPNRVTSIAALEALYTAPKQSSLDKELKVLNKHYRQLIEASPFFAIASVGHNGLDCSPRGDTSGFVHIHDDHTLIIPDRRGNNRLDTLRNIVADPRVSLLFLIPGLNETLRIKGTAYLSTEEKWLALLEVNGKRPVTAIVVHIECVYFQCARALKRSQLWNNALHVDPATLPSAGTLIRSAIEGFDADNYDADLQERQADSLY